MGQGESGGDRLPLASHPRGTADEQPEADDDEHYRQRRADAALLTVVKALNWQGPAFTMLEKRLLDSATKFLGRLVRREEIFDRCARIGRPITAGTAVRTALCTDVDLRAGLVNEAVDDAWRAFKRDALQGGGWRVDGGATLEEYFHRRVLYSFAKVFRARQAEERLWRKTVLMADMPAHATFPRDTRLSLDKALSYVEDHLPGETDENRRILALLMTDYTHREIAERLGLPSAQVVTQRVYRLRMKLKRDLAGGIEPTERRTSP